MRRTRRQHQQHRGLTFNVLVVVPFCIALVLQGILCVAVLERSQTLPAMEGDAYGLFSERIASSASYLENDMIMRWSNISSTASLVEDGIGRALQDAGADASDIALGSDAALAAVDAVADDLVSLSRRAEVDGVFLVLAGGPEAAGDGRSQYPGFYLRDSNPKVDVENRSDLLLGACPISVGRRLGLALDSLWSASLSIAPEGDPTSDFFYRPLRAAEQYPDADVSDLGYWGAPTDLGWSGTSSLTYSMPVRDSSGAVVAVLGVEVKAERMAGFFPYRELDTEGNGSYALSLVDGSLLSDGDEAAVLKQGQQRTFQVLATTGASQSLYVSGGSFKAVVGNRGFMEVLPAEGSSATAPAAASAAELKLYDSTSPFADERWVLVGMEGDDVLYAASDGLFRSLLTVFALSLAIGVVVAALAAWVSTSRMRQVMKEMRTAAPDEPIEFTPTGIREVDQLADAVSILGAEVAASASRLSRILTLSDRMIGAFEFNGDTGALSFTDRFLEALGVDAALLQRIGLDAAVMERKAMPTDDFRRMVNALHPQKEAQSGSEVRYLVETAGPPRRWARLVVRDGGEQGYITGLVEDVTEEITTRRRLEHERDHDILTGLVNRRAFEEVVGRRLQQDPPPFAAMLMMDLDNLKFINDSYGHDWGDLYIKAAANVLYRVFGNAGVCSRISGDEFLVFLDACPDEETAHALFASLERELASARLEAPDGDALKVRASTGVAFYPKDAQTFKRLREYADFAMYEAKNSRKGELSSFDRASYEEQSYLLRKKEDLNKLLEDHLVDYCFQPIVDVRAVCVMGYEALMRPRLPSIPTPDHVIKLARSQSKLYLVERMTFFESLASFSRFPVLGDRALFVNSIGTQRMSPVDEEHLARQYGPLFLNVVVEFTENDYDHDIVADKERLLRDWGCRIAIDDFGSGMNSETMLLDVAADFVKLDMKIVRDIDSSRDNRDIACSLIEYAHARGIKVIAEGVETAAELRTVMDLGADFVQGYLTGRPAAEPAELDERVARLIRVIGGDLRG